MNHEANMPVFAHIDPNGNHWWGLTKRELFAVMALQGLLSSPDELYFGSVSKPYNPFPDTARHAVEAADALLAALEAGK